MVDKIVQNRQINFYIMRAVWNKKKEDKGNNTIKGGLETILEYTDSKDKSIHVNLTRERISKMINGKPVSLHTNACLALHRLTHISVEIFQGKEIFTLKGFDRDRLYSYFQTKASDKNDSLLTEELDKAIDDQINLGVKGKEHDFNELCKFIDIRLSIMNHSLESLLKEIDAISFEEILQTDQKVLEDYSKKLKIHYKKVETAIYYKKYK